MCYFRIFCSLYFITCEKYGGIRLLIFYGWLATLKLIVSGQEHSLMVLDPIKIKGALQGANN